MEIFFLQQALFILLCVGSSSKRCGFRLENAEQKNCRPATTLLCYRRSDATIE